jgi:hypothetical protein
MPKNKPITGPMRTQPIERASDDADTSAAYDANCRKGSEDAATEAGNSKDRSGPCRESENNAAELLAETAGHSEALTLPMKK